MVHKKTNFEYFPEIGDEFRVKRISYEYWKNFLSNKLKIDQFAQLGDYPIIIESHLLQNVQL